MTQVTIHQAKAQLSRLIQKALAGEEVVIANRDKPVVRLTVVDEARPKRRLGFLAKEFAKLEGFDDPKLNAAIIKDFSRIDPEDPLFKQG
jgi:prevent-host-death family protein